MQCGVALIVRCCRRGLIPESIFIVGLLVAEQAGDIVVLQKDRRRRRLCGVQRGGKRTLYRRANRPHGSVVALAALYSEVSGSILDPRPAVLTKAFAGFVTSFSAMLEKFYICLMRSAMFVT